MRCEVRHAPLPSNRPRYRCGRPRSRRAVRRSGPSRPTRRTGPRSPAPARPTGTTARRAAAARPGREPRLREHVSRRAGGGHADPVAVDEREQRRPAWVPGDRWRPDADVRRTGGRRRSVDSTTTRSSFVTIATVVSCGETRRRRGVLRKRPHDARVHPHGRQRGSPCGREQETSRPTTPGAPFVGPEMPMLSRSSSRVAVQRDASPLPDPRRRESSPAPAARRPRT